MTVVVAFCKAAGVRGNSANAAIASARVREDLALDGVSTETVEAGDIVIIGNAETDMIAVAFGIDPDADTTAADADSTAGIPVAAGDVVAFTPVVGSKVSVKAL